MKTFIFLKNKYEYYAIPAKTKEEARDILREANDDLYQYWIPQVLVKKRKSRFIFVKATRKLKM